MYAPNVVQLNLQSIVLKMAKACLRSSFDLHTKDFDNFGRVLLAFSILGTVMMLPGASGT